MKSSMRFLFIPVPPGAIILTAHYIGDDVSPYKGMENPSSTHLQTLLKSFISEVHLARLRAHKMCSLF